MTSSIPMRAAVLAALCALTAGSAAAQTWEYKSYKRSLGGQYNKENFVLGSITLEERDGHATLRMVAGAVDACRRGEMPAQVTRGEGTITIEPELAMAGCERWRVVIRADGSGGRREVWRNDQWVDSRWDHGLTLRP